MTSLRTSRPTDLGPGDDRQPIGSQSAATTGRAVLICYNGAMLHSSKDAQSPAETHEFVSCDYSSLCSGCDNLLVPYSQQRADKIEHLKETWSRVLPMNPALAEVGWIEIDRSGLRDRADLIIDRRSGEPRLGLFDKARSGVVDLQNCAQMSPALEAWLQEFRKIEIPVERGSIRLRVAPNGQRGVWLDLANVDVKRLLDERITLDLLRSQSIVEIGQRRKRLVEREGRLKLDDPVLEPWFETYASDGSALALYCSIGSFTQPGFRANRVLVQEVLFQASYAAASVGASLGASLGASARVAKRAAEFGSGIGNFTLPLASIFDEVAAYEVDRLALAGLKRSAEEHGLSEKIRIFEGNFQIERKAKLELEDLELVLVDPPRSGLMRFLDPLQQLTPAKRPKRFVYVSCFAESFSLDAERLLSLGYSLERISVVDQFPQSRHYEIVATFINGAS